MLNSQQAGHIYLVSYPELCKLVSSLNHLPQAACFVAAPMCMLYVRTDTELVPIAIQLAQKPGDHPMLFTPRDDQWVSTSGFFWVLKTAHKITLYGPTKPFFFFFLN